MDQKCYGDRRLGRGAVKAAGAAGEGVSRGFPEGFPRGLRGFPGVSEQQSVKLDSKKHCVLLYGERRGRGFQTLSSTPIIILIP